MAEERREGGGGEGCCVWSVCVRACVCALDMCVVHVSDILIFSDRPGEYKKDELLEAAR